MSREEEIKIRELFSKTYPDIVSAQRMVDDAGITEDNIDYSGNPSNRWFKIFKEAKKQNKFYTLILLYESDIYPNEFIQSLQNQIKAVLKAETKNSISSKDTLNTTKDELEKIETALEQGENLDIILEDFLALLKSQKSRYYNDLVLLKRRYVDLSKAQRMELESNQEVKIAKNKITQAIMELVRLVKKESRK